MRRGEKKFVGDPPSETIGSANYATKVPTKLQLHDRVEPADKYAAIDLNLDLREIYFLIMHFLSAGPCKKTFRQLYTELQEHQLLPRRYHAWYSRNGADWGEENVGGISLPLNYDELVGRYPHIRRDHLVCLLKQLMELMSPPSQWSTHSTEKNVPSATDVPTLLGSGSFSLLSYDRNKGNKGMRKEYRYLQWPHTHADQVRGLSLREIGGGFPRYHRAPSIRLPCYTIAKPSSMVLKMQNMKKLRGHRDAVYCAIFDRTGQHVITGSDDRLVKIWSMETALCLASCRGHEGDITDLSVSSNNAVVASASNDFTIRVWRLPDGYPISVLRGHAGAVTAIAFSPSSRPTSFYQLLSSSDDGTCRIWDARYSDSHPRVYMPKPIGAATATASSFPTASSFLSASAPSNATLPSHQILFCAYNANGTAFVTGSSDTFARVWNACKPSLHEPDKPIHEMDILAGHENDVNYVQFSGCAVALCSFPSDCYNEDGVPKFKNSWFNHDSIVTCSRDGSAIIWVPKLRKSHGKVGRWVRSYHLKVPPPPMPPRPTQGGPRRRFLPTPRGVNMIVWSLDNRFVLAAIMDNRICVWNAVDGSLVHSLAGHTASTYVLDVHPFNPRIALSAGYDGKTILWDIWEGTPVKVYDLGGCLKLVDGKFSQDGTSIVLSDDLGQIYLINTGEGEAYKDAQYDQFFLGDYRPLTQDTHGNVVDQETQLSPYLRNIQDTLCDSSMLPYPEPYQSMYQRRRLGALGIEWRPSSIKFAIGMGQDIPILPLPDLDTVEPLPDYGDAIYWEPENDGINDDNDSEYNANEEIFSEERHKCSDNTSGSECDEEVNDNQSQKDYNRRSKRRKYAREVELISGIRTKNRNKDDKERTSPRVRTSTKSKFYRSSSETQPSKVKSLRSRRAASRIAVSSFSNSAETSLDEEDDEFSLSESDSDLFSEDSLFQSEEKSDCLVDKQNSGTVTDSTNGGEDFKNSPTQPRHQISGGNQKRLVFKISLNQKSATMSSENHVDQVKCQATQPSSSLRFFEDNRVQKKVDSGSRNVDSSSANMHEKEPRANCRRQCEDEERTLLDEKKCIASTSSADAVVRLEKIKIRMPNSSISGAGAPVESTAKTSEKQLRDDGSAITKTHNCDTLEGSPSNLDRTNMLHIADKHLSQMPNSVQKKRNVIKIRSTKFSGDITSQVKPQTVSGSDSSCGAVGFKNHHTAVESPAVSLNRKSFEWLETANDSADRATLYKTEVARRDSGSTNSNLDSRDDYLKFNTCIDRENMPVRDDDYFPSEGSNRGEHKGRQNSYFVETSKHTMPKKSNWLLLTGQEGGYRYIPQLGDEVVYLKQGHKDFIIRSQPIQHESGLSYGDSLRAVEVCLVDDLEYASHTGSGESCCQMTLKLIDPTCNAYGKKIQLTLPELDDFPDFIVEKMWYDATMGRNWSVGEKCLVWWRDNNEQGGAWWEGQVMNIKDKDDKIPGSPWERYLVQYETDAEIHPHCPWELHGSEGQWEQPTIDFKTKGIILSSFNELYRRAHKNKDSYGIIKLNEASLKMDFVNRFPVPLSPDVIKTRLGNDYYRSLTALKHDFEVMMSNAESYFQKNPEVLRKIKHLEVWFSEIFTSL